MGEGEPGRRTPPKKLAAGGVQQVKQLQYAGQYRPVLNSREDLLLSLHKYTQIATIISLVIQTTTHGASYRR